MSKCPHTEFRKGQRLMIIMISGDRIIDKYVEKKSGAVVLSEHGRVRLRDVRSITIFRGRVYAHKSGR